MMQENFQNHDICKSMGKIVMIEWISYVQALHDLVWVRHSYDFVWSDFFLINYFIVILKILSQFT